MKFSFNGTANNNRVWVTIYHNLRSSSMQAPIDLAELKRLRDGINLVISKLEPRDAFTVEVDCETRIP